MKKSQLRNSLLAVSALSVSIASQLHGATYDSSGSVTNDDWSDPLSWTYVGGVPVATFPDTFNGDTAHIIAGDFIDFNAINGVPDGPLTTPKTRVALDPTLIGAGLVLGQGSLAVAKGGLINIDGGTLTNSQLNNEIRIGDGVGGAGTGTGTLTIRNGGTFSSGDGSGSGGAIGVVVGGNMGVGASGNGAGTVNIEDGLFLMGDGLFTTIPALGLPVLGVGIEGSTGTINVGNGVGAAASATLNLKLRNNRMVVGGTNGTPAGSTAGTGFVVLNSDGSILQGTGSIVVGDSRSSAVDFGTGTLTISGGSLGQGVATTGELRVGSNGGVGTLSMTAGTVDTRGEFNIGRGTGFGTPSVGTATISFGAGSSFGVGETSVGRGGGTGTWNVSGAATTAVVNGALYIGRDTGSTGTLNIAGSTVNVTGITGVGVGGGNGTVTIASGLSTTNLGVGQGGGTGSVSISAGTLTVNSGGGQSYIGNGGGSVGTVNVSGTAVLNNISGQDHQIGFNGGTGNLNVTGGGTMTHNWWVNVARGGGSVGHITVDGAGSKMVMSDGQTNIGEDGSGTLDIINGGLYQTPNNEFSVARNGGSTGVVTVNTGGYLKLLGSAFFGRSAGANATLNITGPTAKVDGFTAGGSDFFRVASGGATGTVNITAGGTLNANAGWFTVGENNGSTGTATVDGAGSSITSNGLIVGWNGLSTGTLNIQNGATVTSTGREVSIGRDDGGANSPTGIIKIVSGGTLTGRDFRIGHNATGTVNINGGTLNSVGGWAIIGDGGPSHGTVNLDAGTMNHSDWLLVGNNPGSHGTLNINGGTINVDAGGDSGRLITARQGTAVVNQTGGDVHVGNWFAIGIDGGGNGTYNFGGGTLSVRSNIDIGNNGTGVMNVTHGNLAGTTITGNSLDNAVNAFNVGGDTTGNGTLNINLTNPAGKIVSRELYGGWNGGTGTVNITSGTLQTNGWVEFGRGQNGKGGTGTVNVDGTNARWEVGTLPHTVVADSTNGRDMNFGQGENDNIGKGYLNVKNGGTVNTNWWINLARQHATEGHMTIDGAGSVVNMVDSHSVGRDGNTQLNVGEGGKGTLDIKNGGVLNHSMDHGGGEVHIARNTGSIGTLTVDGAGSQLNSKGREFRVSQRGTGVLNITNGGVVNFSSTRENGVKADGNFGVGHNDSGDGTINMNGGQLNVSAWSLFGAWDQATTKATINMTNSVINITDEAYVDGGGGAGNGGHLFWGDAGTAVINQEGGAINAHGWSAIGRERGGNSTYNLGVLGGGGVMTVGGLGGNELYVGRQSHGTITMGPGTSITVAGAMNLAQENSPTTPSTGTVINDGGALRVANSGGGEFNVGRNGGPGNVAVYTQTAGSLFAGQANNEGVWVGRDSTQGTLNLFGGTADFAGGLNIGAGSGGSVGTVNVTNAGTVMTVNGWTTMGRDTGGSATTSTVNVTNNGLLQHLSSGGGDFLIGWQNGSTATVNVNTGGDIIHNWWFRAGIDPGSKGDVIVDGVGSTISRDTGRTYIGERGIGTLTIKNGATFIQTNSDQFNVGGNDNSANGDGDGTITVTNAGSKLQTNNFLRVGFGNTGAADPAVGRLNVSDNATVIVNGWFGVGQDGGDGTLNMTGGTMQVDQEFYVGIDTNGHARNSTGAANVTGGSITARNVIVGRNGGTGTLNVSAPAVITSTQHVNIGDGGGGNGTVNQSSGTVNVSGEWFALAPGGGSTGTYNISDGVLNAGTIGVEVGADGNGFLNISGTGQVIANNVAVGVRDTGVGVINMTGGLLHANDHITLGGDQSGGAGTLNANGGVVEANYIATQDVATLSMNGGTIRANVNEPNFLRGFNNAGGHSAIIMVGAGGTIDSNGKNIGITAGNEITGTTLTKVGAGALTINALQTYNTLEVNGGRVNLNSALNSATINANTGILVVNASLTNTDVNVDNTNSTYFTVDQNLNSLTIANGGYVEIGTTPPPAPAPAFDGGAGDAGGFESSVADASNPLLVTSSVQGVPEPGTVSLLLLSALGLLGRRQRQKRD